MKSDQLFVGLFVLLLGLCGAVAFPVVWDCFHTLYPTAQTESTFLRNYTPKLAIEGFEEQPSRSGRDYTAAPGRGFVTHTLRFDWQFAMRPEKRLSLMNALRDDASAQLVVNGARILSQNGNPHDGFHFDYKLGKSVGALTILPLVVAASLPNHRDPLLPEGTVDVTVNIEQKEMWFPKEAGTIQVTFNNSVH